jgi:hypothetical protein
MLKKTITYNDLDGNPVTEDFYFNLSKAEMAEMELRHEGGFSGYLQRIIDTQNGNEIISTFKNIITSAYGRRSEDNRRFIKSPEITDAFLQTEAYSELFMELVTNGEAAAEFVQAIMPSDMVDAVLNQMPVTDVPLPDVVPVPAYMLESREPTKRELLEMSKQELQQAFQWKNNQPKGAS